MLFPPKLSWDVTKDSIALSSSHTMSSSCHFNWVLLEYFCRTYKVCLHDFCDFFFFKHLSRTLSFHHVSHPPPPSPSKKKIVSQCILNLRCVEMLSHCFVYNYLKRIKWNPEWQRRHQSVILVQLINSRLRSDDKNAHSYSILSNVLTYALR